MANQNCTVKNKKISANKHTIEFIVSKIAKSKPNIRLISTEYKGSLLNLEWECLICSNKFEARWSDLDKAVKGCSNCAGTKKYSLESIKHFIKENNLGLLPVFREYNGASEKYLWKCDKCSNEWSATWNNINTKKSGYPKCSGNSKWNLDRALDYIKGKSLSIMPLTIEIKGVKTVYSWKCNYCSNIFESNWDKILQRGNRCKCGKGVSA